MAVPHGQGAIADYANVKMRLAQLPGAYVAAELESHPSALAIFLGSYGGRLGEHVIAVDVTHVQPNDTTLRLRRLATGGADARSPKCRRTNRRKTRNRCWKARQPDSTGVDLRGFAPHASAREAGQATSAISLSMWHARQRHCPTCGAPVEPALGGWAQHCTNDEDGNRLLFPPNRASGDHRDRRP